MVDGVVFQQLVEQQVGFYEQFVVQLVEVLGVVLLGIEEVIWGVFCQGVDEVVLVEEEQGGQQDIGDGDGI